MESNKFLWILGLVFFSGLGAMEKEPNKMDLSFITNENQLTLDMIRETVKSESQHEIFKVATKKDEAKRSDLKISSQNMDLEAKSADVKELTIEEFKKNEIHAPSPRSGFQENEDPKKQLKKKPVSPAELLGALKKKQMVTKFNCKQKLSNRGLKTCFWTNCNRKFTCPSHLVIHMRTHTKIKPYECSKCSKSFSTKSNLTSHLNVHVGGLFFCKHCRANFAHERRCTQHEKDCPKKSAQ